MSRLLHSLILCSVLVFIFDCAYATENVTQPLEITKEVVAAEGTGETLVVAPPSKPAGVIKAVPDIGSGRHLLSVILGLLAIVIFIFFLSWFVKRFSLGDFSANTNLKVVASLPLGTRERLLVVDVGGQQILLGVSAAGISNLHLLSTPLVKPSESQSDFSQKLMAVLQQKNTNTTVSFDDPQNTPSAKESL